MHYSPSTMSRLIQVRELRMRQAELELARADEAAAASRQSEEQAVQALAETTALSATATEQAHRHLVGHARGGRRGISEWQAACRRAKSAVQAARGTAAAAAADSAGREADRLQVRARCRQARFDAERLRLLADQMAQARR